MPKRAREVSVVPASLSNLPYSTIDGGKWLKKALDPVDTMTDVAGLPDINTNQRAVLNYQMQNDVPVPRTDTFNPNIVQSYDADLYLYQDPIIYGMSSSYPQGTKNPGEFPITIEVITKNLGGGNISYNCNVRFASGTVPRTCNIFYNSQIEGDTPTEKLKSLQKYCQRCRLIYGGVQAIPACSALFDSGTTEATQQIFSPENKMITNLNVPGHTNTPFRCQVFKKDDFPDEGSSIQNATSLYCRYKEGLYMPYKLVNPLVYPYKGSEEKCLMESPFVVTGVYPKVNWRTTHTNLSNPTDITTFDHYEDFTFDVETNSYKSATYTTSDGVHGPELYIECVSKLGQKFYFKVDTVVKDPPFSVAALVGFTMTSTLTLPSSIGSYPQEISNIITHNNPELDYLRCTSITQAPFSTETIDTVTFMMPQIQANIGIVCFRSIGLQASIRLIFRVGLEMMIVAGGVYSPFKHKSPNYDQRALNSYVRACHAMRDAFLGNAATPEGHSEYAAHIAEIVADQTGTSTSNLGSRWYGKVSV